MTIFSAEPPSLRLTAVLAVVTDSRIAHKVCYLCQLQGWLCKSIQFHCLQWFNRSWSLSDGNVLYHLCFFCQLLDDGSLTPWSSDAILWVALVCILCNSPLANLADLEEAYSSTDRAG